ncbi:homocysteine S-methyltransferase [Paenibacillus hunanensis]|uniref:homocysteine S-methyltransferase n=1 Tax=Paenibacillus hunanensis TaxID=539262 RepID=UPI002A6A950E|nr:homocysteine S-methyltransferase [Paenibacillus hunanensis]WPP40300.1 homocysteine S-methyltransferase [Paenibacillus hunanensis]
MNHIKNILDQYPLIILDGAMATELEKDGADLNDDLWSARLLLDNPQAIAGVHRRYFEAGADCAITASYQATVSGFMERGLSAEEATALIARSVQLAVDERDVFWSGYIDAQQEAGSSLARPRPLVAASVGPYGAYLADGSEYRGDYGLSEQELYDFHYDRMRILIEAGADVLACETIPCLVEAQAIVRALEQFPNVYAWISFSARDGAHISSGEAVTDCAAWLDGHEQVAALGINCTALEYIPALIEAISAHTSKPILVYPNSGEQYDPVTKTWHGTACAGSYGEHARTWYELGARLIGGCCRTTPADIAEVGAAIRS